MVRSYRNKVLFVVLLNAALITPSFSQQSIKVAVFNSQKIFETSEEGKKTVAQLRDKDQKIRAELAALDKQAQDLETKINTQRLTLTQEAYEQMLGDLDKIRTKRKRAEEDSTNDFQQLRMRLSNRIIAEVMPIIEALAKEREIDVVLDLTVSGVVYFHPQSDITDEVIKRYDASRIPKK